MPGLSLSVDASQLESAQRKFRNTANNIGQYARRMKTKMDTVNESIGTMNSKIGSMVKGLGSWQTAMAGAAGAAGLGYMINRSLAATQQLEKLSRQTGFSTKAIQELNFAARQTGVSSNRLYDALGELTQRMGEAAADGGEMAEGFKAAGIQIDDLSRRKPQKVFYQISDAIKNADTQAQALNIAVKTFGDEGGRDMVAMLREGSGALRDMAERANKLGLVLDEDVVKQSARAKEKVDLLVDVMGTQWQRVIGELAPKISEVADNMGDWVSNNQDFIEQDIPNKISDITGEISGFASAISSIPDPVLYGGLGAVFGGRFGGKWGAAAGAITGISAYTINEIEAGEPGERKYGPKTGTKRGMPGHDTPVDFYNLSQGGEAQISIEENTKKTEENNQAKEKNIEKTKQQIQTLDQYLNKLQETNRQAETFGDISFQPFGKSGSLDDMMNVTPMINQLDSQIAEMRERYKEFWMLEGQGLSPEDLQAAGKKAGDNFIIGFESVLESLKRSAAYADSLEDFGELAAENLGDTLERVLAEQLSGVGEDLGSTLGQAIGSSAGAALGGKVGAAAGSIVGQLATEAWSAANEAIGRETYKASVNAGETTGTVLGKQGEMSDSLQESISILEEFKQENTLLLSNINSNLKAATAGAERAIGAITRNYSEFGGMGSGQAGPGLARQGGELGMEAALGYVSSGVYTGWSKIADQLGGFFEKVMDFPGDLVGEVASEVFGGDASVKERGITFDETRLGQLRRGGGIEPRAYAKIKEEGGWFSGSDTSWEFSQLSDAATTNLNNVFQNVSDTLVKLGKDLGADMQEVLNYTFDPDNLNLKGLSAEKRQKKVEKYFSTQMDVAVEDLYADALKKYQRVNEGLMETASRVVSVKNVMIDLFSKTRNELDATVAQAMQAKEAFGGLDQAQQAVSRFYQNFVPEKQQQQYVKSQMQEVFDSVNRQVPETRQAFYDLVSGLDLTTESNREAYATLTQAAGVADKYYSTIEEGAEKQKQAIESIDAAVNKALGKETDFAGLKSKLGIEEDLGLAQYFGDTTKEDLKAGAEQLKDLVGFDKSKLQSFREKVKEAKDTISKIDDGSFIEKFGNLDKLWSARAKKSEYKQKIEEMLEPSKLSAKEQEAILNKLVTSYEETTQAAKEHRQELERQQQAMYEGSLSVRKALSDDFNLGKAANFNLLKKKMGLQGKSLGMLSKFGDTSKSDLQSGLDQLNSLMSEGTIEVGQYNTLLNKLTTSYNETTQAAKEHKQELERQQQTLAEGRMSMRDALGKDFSFDIFKKTMGIDKDLGLSGLFGDTTKGDLQSGFQQLNSLLNEGTIETEQYNTILDKLISSYKEASKSASDYSNKVQEARSAYKSALQEDLQEAQERRQELKNNIADKKDTYVAAIQREIDANQEAIQSKEKEIQERKQTAEEARQEARQTAETWGSLAQNLRTTRQELLTGSQSSLSPDRQMQEAGKQFQQAISSGSIESYERLSSLANTYLESAQSAIAMPGRYQDVFANVQSQLQQAAGKAESQKSSALQTAKNTEATVGALRQQIDQLESQNNKYNQQIDELRNNTKVQISIRKAADAYHDAKLKLDRSGLKTEIEQYKSQLSKLDQITNATLGVQQALSNYQSALNTAISSGYDNLESKFSKELKQLKQEQDEDRKMVKMQVGAELPEMGTGGTVTQPTAAVIGDSGIEHITPDSQMKEVKELLNQLVVEVRQDKRLQKKVHRILDRVSGGENSFATRSS